MNEKPLWDEEGDRGVRVRLFKASLELNGAMLLGICMYAELQVQGERKRNPMPQDSAPMPVAQNVIPIKQAM